MEEQKRPGANFEVGNQGNELIDDEFSEDSFDSDDLAESEVSPVKKSSIALSNLLYKQYDGPFANPAQKNTRVFIAI